MDPRERADRDLSRAQARRPFVVTPDSAVSPMDASTTQQIPRSMVQDAEVREIDPDATTVVRHEEIRRQDGQAPYLGDREPTSQLGGVEVEPEPEVVFEELDGLIPTTTQQTPSTLSQRLEG